MTVVDSVEVFPSFLRHRRFDLSWRVRSDEFDVKTLLFLAESAERESGPWISMMDAPIAGISGADGAGKDSWTGVPAGFVRVAVFSPSGARLSQSSAFTYGPAMSRREILEYREQLRLENLSLEKFVGVKTLIHHRSALGCKCPECSDEILNGAPDSNCSTCFGTGMKDGYLPSIEMMADWSAEARGSGNQTMGQLGPSEAETRTIRVMPFPSLASKDLVIQSGSGTVWEVSEVSAITWKIWPVARRAVIKLLPKSDPTYKLLRKGAR